MRREENGSKKKRGREEEAKQTDRQWDLVSAMSGGLAPKVSVCLSKSQVPKSGVSGAANHDTKLPLSQPAQPLMMTSPRQARSGHASDKHHKQREKRKEYKYNRGEKRRKEKRRDGDQDKHCYGAPWQSTAAAWFSWHQENCSKPCGCPWHCDVLILLTQDTPSQFQDILLVLGK